ncbi:hypothetical protein PVK06_047160 [Gossypium arboreum]|uniref:DUF2497 domain-containing protein n=1 Tax=Gossypium arboreum TaxID=29729 RepID=A0ABR0MCY8_GOSAR|nr:hypothetical protein PVK06_047160 [Gossypium arboreum]
MDSEGTHDREELFVSPEREIVKEPIVNVSTPTLGSDNPEVGTEALTRLVREVLEEVFEAWIKKNSEVF